jgi:hypothetical protein
MTQETAGRGADTAGTSTAAWPQTAAVEDDFGDNLRHIVCVLCYPAFRGTRQAPHDAVCVCGKPLRAGDIPNPSTSAQCILCDELWDHHCDTLHPDE